MKSKLLLIICLIWAFESYSQNSKFRDFLDNHHLDIELRAGVIIGGIAPIPLPAEIREIVTYSPEFNGLFGIQLTRWFSDKYGFSSGLRFENKGMETSALVKLYHTKIVNQGDEVAGYWTGNVRTTAKISYLTIPFLANIQLHPRWRIQAGAYLSYNMTGKFFGKVSQGYLRENTPVGQKIEFKGEQYAAYDFSSDLHKLAYGGQLNAQWKATSNLFVLLQFTWGLNDIFKSDFEVISFGMYPIYISLGASYLF